ncbi:restriction endonuclease subunit S [Pseudomonas carnis]|uniref:restriction endonuclease subunit S n=1 Tax=Pseudomonas carnis TaxID=2487355 RepID=UPI0018E64B20|nr:restriction endonuclease subunit S [Pseudomonas carnis]MBI6654276.1 restriction endonuclease subunit S [Pseudomonas carnis]MBI6661515.1 restriction endonuclease subunit S [Pseudomonas carnis]MBI6687983.1 restriction endonuclease subunit S [Pseudomonas carnis]
MSFNYLNKLADFVTLIRGTTYKGELVGKPGPALLGLGSIQPGGGFREADFKTYGGDCPRKLMLFPGDLFASLKGATKDGKMIGSVARVPKIVQSGRLTQDTVKLEFIVQDKSVQNYIYWILRTPQYREYCAGRAMGSAVVALSRGDFLSYPIPALTHYRAKLVELFEVIEERIRLLRDLNTILETVAQTLFKSWFIDFEPVHAKATGFKPQGMDVDTAALFPQSFDESEIGLVPRGWHVKSIGDAVECMGGGTPNTKDPNYWEPAEHAWTTPKDLSGQLSPVLLSTERKLSTLGLAKVSSGLLPSGTLLLSSRAPIGYLAIAQVPIAVNQGYIAIPPGGELPPLYMLFWCRQNMEGIKARANGSTFMEISKKAFRPIPALVPPMSVVAAFANIANPLFERLIENERQTQTLTELRDALLPRLISGQLRPADAEVNVENVRSEVI